ncbi:Uncharacterised protein [Mycobacteroides abscessus subsp. massiliense]|nr:Uncharacterised protein [Mycobacteroides abscessus subsp. massiliense]
MLGHDRFVFYEGLCSRKFFVTLAVYVRLTVIHTALY